MSCRLSCPSCTLTHLTPFQVTRRSYILPQYITLGGVGMGRRRESSCRLLVTSDNEMHTTLITFMCTMRALRGFTFDQLSSSHNHCERGQLGRIGKGGGAMRC